MPTFDDIARIALALPETEEGVRDAGRVWRVRGTAFVWERPLRPADWGSLYIEPNDRPVFCANVEGEPEKLGLIGADANVFFTTPHFDGYPAILAWLDRISLEQLEEVVTDAWLARAPKRLAREFLELS